MNDLKEIWLTLSGRFYRVAYYLLDSQEDAEDAVQELYLRIFSGSKNMMDVKNVVVVVSRWWGGILLGPGRQ